MAAKVAWQPGDAGFPADMSEVDFSPVGEGGEIWARGYFYFPAGWSWTAISHDWQVTKILRMHTANGQQSIVIDNNGLIITGNEVADRQLSSSVHADIGRWQALEIYIKVSSGSSGIMRVWKDGILITEDAGHMTIVSGGSIGYSLITPYWNQAGPAQAQNSYEDDFVYTTDTPSNVDAHGNHMIGPTGGSTDTTPPSAPSGLSVL